MSNSPFPDEKVHADDTQLDEAPLHFDTSHTDLTENIRAAKSATDKEHNMTLLEGIRLYPKAVAWSVLISTCICMEGYGALRFRVGTPVVIEPQC